MTYVEPLMRQNFLEYASYVIVDRAIPDLRDGCKPVQRRILATLFSMDDGRFNKVANVIGETMKLHPHGDASIGDALVVLANKDYFIERQGNFGNILTGHSAAAPRYIECRLTDLARKTLFNSKLTETRPSYDGRRQEPVYLPSKLPVVLMLGIEGIAVGMSTRVLPHNFGELLAAQIALLRHQPIALVPDFQQGALMDPTEYEDGRGRVRIRARLKVARDKKAITIEEVPYSTTTESLIQSIEVAAQRGKLKIGSIEDRTAESVEIILKLTRGIYADEVVPQLYAYTQCEVSISSSVIVIDQGKPVELTVSEVLERATNRLRQQISAELALALEELSDRQHFLTLEQIFIENRVYKRIEEARTKNEVTRQVRVGMERFRQLFVRDLEDEDIERLLRIRIRRISLYDIEKNRRELEEVASEMSRCKRRLRELTKTTIRYLEDLISEFGDRYQRKTEVTSFDQVSKKEVARQNVKLSFDPDSGFFGSAVKGSKYSLTVSEYAKILVIRKDGTYRIIAAPEKTFVGERVFSISHFDETEGQVLTFVYRDKKKIAWGKKIKITGFITDKEYELVKDKLGTIVKLFLGEVDHLVHMHFVPMKRQRVTEGTFDLASLTVCGLAARGSRMAPKAVSRFAFRKASRK